MAYDSLKNSLKNFAKGLTETPVANDLKNVANELWENRDIVIRNYLADQYLKQHKENAANNTAANTANAASTFNIDNSYASVVPFINAYRDALGRQRDLNKQAIESNRRDQYQNIMGAANTAGMMYSNFPERAKMLYDTNTYMPALTDNQTTYQTGIDKLRSNTVNYLNQLKDINDAIADLSTSSTSNNSGDADYLKNLYEQLSKLYGTDTE